MSIPKLFKNKSNIVLCAFCLSYTTITYKKLFTDFHLYENVNTVVTFSSTCTKVKDFTNTNIMLQYYIDIIIITYYWSSLYLQ